MWYTPKKCKLFWGLDLIKPSHLGVPKFQAEFQTKPFLRTNISQHTRVSCHVTTYLYIYICMHAYRDDCISVTKCDPASCRMNEHYETATDHGFVLHCIMFSGIMGHSESCRSNPRVTCDFSNLLVRHQIARGRHGQTLSRLGNITTLFQIHLYTSYLVEWTSISKYQLCHFCWSPNDQVLTCAAAKIEEFNMEMWRFLKS